jgi:CBS domain-containing protein
MEGLREVQRNTDDIASFVKSRDCGFTTVRQILAKKPAGTWVIRAEASVYDALLLMAERNVGALVVLDGEQVVGVISERDYARKVILIGKASRETFVSEIMSSPAVTVDLGTTVAQCMELMTGRCIRHLPVVESGILVGCVSIGDVVKTLIVEQGRRIGDFENYIRGSYPM